jgi:hypothetical protein
MGYAWVGWRRAAGTALVAVAILLVGAQTCDAQRTSIKGTVVSLIPPKGFAPAPDFAGLVNAEGTASVLVVELRAAARGELGQLFRNLATVKTNFARQGVAINSLETIRLPVGKVPLAIGAQTINGLAFDKWIALITGAKTVLITVQAQQTVKLQTAAVKAMLKSVALEAPASIPKKMAALPFTIDVAAPFRAIDTLAGMGVILTVGPLDEDPTYAQPSIIVTYQQVPALAGRDAEEVSEVVLRSVHGFANAKIGAKERVAFAGTSGVRTRGTRKADGKERGFVHQFALWSEGRSIIFIATAEEQRMRELQPAIDAIAASILPKSN